MRAGANCFSQIETKLWCVRAGGALLCGEMSALTMGAMYPQGLADMLTATWQPQRATSRRSLADPVTPAGDDAINEEDGRSAACGAASVKHARICVAHAAILVGSIHGQ